MRVDLGVDGDRLPALALAAVGMGVVVLAVPQIWGLTLGYPGPEVEVTVDGTCGERRVGYETGAIVTPEVLSDGGRRAFSRARAAPSNETWVAPETLPLEGLAERSAEYVLAEGRLYAFGPTGDRAANGSRRYAVERVRTMPPEVRAVNGFHRLDGLTDRERRAFRRARTRGETTVRGTMPNLDAAGDHVSLGNGFHCVSADGTYYRVTVWDNSGFLPPNVALVFWIPVLVVGVATALLGRSDYAVGRTRRPTALLAGYAVALVPPAPFVVGPFRYPSSAGLAPVVGWVLSIPVVVVGVAAALRWRDGGAVATRTESESD